MTLVKWPSKSSLDSPFCPVNGTVVLKASQSFLVAGGWVMGQVWGRCVWELRYPVCGFIIFLYFALSIETLKVIKAI